VSVAFRRESDDEHKEPKFDIPIRPGPNLVTERGLRMIEDRVADLEAVDTPDEEQQRELRYWRQRLATAQIGPVPAEDEVGFGSLGAAVRPELSRVLPVHRSTVAAGARVRRTAKCRDSRTSTAFSNEETSMNRDQVKGTMKDKMGEVLATLTDRERTVLIERFGLLDGKPKTLEEVGVRFKVTRERVRQIEAKALRKMRHPTRAKQLQAFLDLLEGE